MNLTRDKPNTEKGYVGDYNISAGLENLERASILRTVSNAANRERERRLGFMALPLITHHFKSPRYDPTQPAPNGSR